MSYEPVAGTVSISDLVMVDIDASGHLVGVEFVMPPSRITVETVDCVAEQFPTLKGLRDLEGWLLTSA